MKKLSDDTLGRKESFYRITIAFGLHTKDLKKLTCPCFWSKLEKNLMENI
jgi:hypothetical protein